MGSLILRIAALRGSWRSAIFALYVELTMTYDNIPLIIPILATGYVLTIYVLLKLAERSQA
jgi:hypothetical protein